MSACPVCSREACHYWELQQRQEWHPPAATLEVAAAPAADTLPPIWRCYVSPTTGVGAVALDPREALFVLANGCTLDGEPYRATLDGFPGTLDGDGRVSVRISRTAPVDAQWAPTLDPRVRA